MNLDLNLLVALDALLREGSVTGAARRMNLSAPAMSRTLARIRDAVGDPILVRAGRKLVPTPRALALRGRVQAVVEDAASLLQAEKHDPRTLERAFTLRTSDALAGVFAEPLTALCRAEAPRVVLRFVPEGQEDVSALREGLVDLDLGAMGPMGPEIRVQKLLQDRFVGTVRKGHPLGRGRCSAKRLTEYPHISVSRRGKQRGPLDDALQVLGFERNIPLVVPSVYVALRVVAGSDMVTVVPERIFERECEGLGLQTFALPATTPPLIICQAWHPRFDADPAHRWLRECIRRVIPVRAPGGR